MGIRNENFSSFRQVDDGLNVSLDSQDILNTEISDVNNMVYRNGYPESRSGSKLKWAKPTGLPTGLVSYYHFDIDSKDSVGSNDGTGTNISYATAGKIGNCATFDGTSSTIAIGAKANLNNAAFSVSAWVNTTYSQGDGASILNNFTQTATLYGYCFEVNTAGIRLVMADGSNPDLYDTGARGSVNDGNWHHVVATFSKPNVVLYIDGAVVYTDSWNHDLSYTGAPTANIGTRNGHYFKGSLDELSIFSRAISVSEVTSIYNSGLGLLLNNLQADSNNLLNLFRTRDSLGNNYCVAVYAPNFYVHDDVNNQWIKLNVGYTPSATYKTYPYGYVNWDAGKSSDVLYAGNGQEDCIKWPIMMRYLTVATGVSDTTITVDDGSYFPSTGFLKLQLGGSSVGVTYSSVSGNVLNLTAPVGAIMPIGSAVVFPIADATTLPKGNILAKFESKLIISGKPKAETTIFGSKTNTPEDFTTTGGATSSFAQLMSDGNGGITSLVNFGEYLLATKQDSAYRLNLIIDTALNTINVGITPVFSDVSLGPVTNAASTKKNDNLLFATLTEGLYSLAPGVTGSNTTVEPSLISQDIYRLYHSLNFASAKAVAWNQFVMWSCASSVVSDTVLVLDLLKSDKKGKFVWTKFDNWGVQDWLVYRDAGGELLYFGNRIDGQIYQAFSADYVDMEQSTGQTPYQCSFTTKRYDYGFSPLQLGQPENSRAMISYFSHPDKIKQADLLHVQGFMTITGKLYIDVMYNENGKLQTLTLSINGSDQLIYQPISPALAMSMMGMPILGGTTLDDFDTLGFINMYLPLPIKYGFLNIQFKFYTTDPGIHWGITGHAYNGMLKDGVPANLVQMPTDIITETSTSPVPAGNIINITLKSWVFDYSSPSWTIDGVNTSFAIPSASQALVWADGVLVKGGGIDYSQSGTSVTFTAGRQPFNSLSISYLPT